MAQSPNQNKYDFLLNQFISNENPMEKDEKDQMKQWLEEATNRVRSQFQIHRGEMINKLVRVRIKCIYLGHDKIINTVANEIKSLSDYSAELEGAMCVSLPSDSSDEEVTDEKKVVPISLFF
jgi:hypothetical protein